MEFKLISSDSKSFAICIAISKVVTNGHVVCIYKISTEAIRVVNFIKCFGTLREGGKVAEE